jgi:hypothetical protein
VRLRHYLVARHDGVHQSHFQRPLRCDALGEQQDLHGVAPRQLPGTVHGRATAREQRPARLGKLQKRFFGDDAQIRIPHHLHAAGRDDAVDRGDDRLVKSELGTIR